MEGGTKQVNTLDSQEFLVNQGSVPDKVIKDDEIVLFGGTLSDKYTIVSDETKSSVGDLLNFSSQLIADADKSISDEASKMGLTKDEYIRIMTP